MEQSQQYFVEEKTPLSSSTTREQVLNSKYFQTVANTVNALIIGAVGSEFDFQNDDELLARGISLTDKLIEKVGEKI